VSYITIHGVKQLSRYHLVTIVVLIEVMTDRRIFWFSGKAIKATKFATVIDIAKL
jgi:hypothetical protein